MNSETISLIGAGTVALLSIICNIISVIVKNRKQSALKDENAEMQKQNTLMEILENIPGYVKQAEQIFNTSGSGPAKKIFVENLVQIACIEKGVQYDKTKVDSKIEEILATPQKKETKHEVL